MKRKPNLLFVFTDEQAAGTMEAYGNHAIHTPNFNRLASESCVFENAYVSQSVCTPSRSTLMTGLYPHNSGCMENNIPLPESKLCVPELADFAGYRTAYHGKWHLGDEIFAQHGFNEWISIEDSYRRYYREGRDMAAHSSYHDFLERNGMSPDRESNGYKWFSRGAACAFPEQFSKPAFLAATASQFIRDNRGSPFMLYVNFFEPHMPYTSCRDGQYDPGDMPLPPNFRHKWREGLPLKLRGMQEYYRMRGHGALALGTDDEWRRLISNYWGLNSLVDTHLGTIMNTLSECGLMDDTIIVYTSDHGDMMGSHMLTAKCVQYQEAVKVPLLLRIPGVTRPGQRVSAPVSHVDLAPTLLDAMGREVPVGLDGFSMMGYLRGSSPLVEQDVFVEWNGPNNGCGDRLGAVVAPECLKDVMPAEEFERSVRDPVRTIIARDGWKYNHSQIGESELYNLNDDPYEMTNLYGESVHEGRVVDLRERLRRWSARTGDRIKI